MPPRKDKSMCNRGEKCRFAAKWLPRDGSRRYSSIHNRAAQNTSKKRIMTSLAARRSRRRSIKETGHPQQGHKRDNERGERGQKNGQLRASGKRGRRHATAAAPGASVITSRRLRVYRSQEIDKRERRTGRCEPLGYLPPAPLTPFSFSLPPSLSPSLSIALFVCALHSQKDARSLITRFFLST